MSVNHIYKVVWSKTKGCYIVVSELAKRVGRNKAKAIVISSAAMAMAVSPVMTSTVSATINQAGTGGNESVAFGEQSTAGGSGAVALGKTATASASGAVALGQETKAEKNNGVAIGKGAKSTEDSAIALGFGSKSSGNWSVAIGLQTNATNKQAVAVGSRSQASGENSIAIGNAANASNEFSVALGSSTTSTNKFTIAVGGKAFANQEGATALGYEARATAKNTIAIGNSAKAEQEGVLALGAQAYAKAADTIAIGNSATAKQVGDIIIGKEAKSRDQGGGRSVAIGFKAVAGSTRNGHEKDDASTGQRGDDGSVAIGTNAYTGLNRNNTAVNNSVALGAGAGVGYRSVGDDGNPLGVGTDADDNDTVLVKAFGGTKAILNNFKNSGTAKADGFFSFQGVDINEGTALGRNTRAIGDQSVAIGAQSVAGMGSIVIGGNDIQAYDQKKYFKAKNPDSGEAKGVNDYNAEVTPGTGKNGQPITIADKYKELVGVGLDRAWRASYGQDGSTVIGMQAHSTTPLGVAIGTNSIVRKGAFGATAIGSGASVVANAEAAVAIGMGSEARGNYAVAAGTAARAKESAVAFGYSSQADVNAVAVGNKSVSKGSAVAVGDESQAVEASVAVGQLAKAKKVADIAVGQGAVASGEQGAIAMGLGTQAQGDSSIMIGGSEITKVAAQTVNYQKEKKDAQGHTIIKSTKKTETIGGEQIERTIRSVEMENTSGTIQQAYGELTNGGTLNTTTLDYSSTTNKNGHGSISMGVHSLSTGDLGTAIGTGARVTKLGGVALGTGAISELQNGVAIGTGSRADMNSIGTRQTDISYDNEGKIVPFDSKKVAYTFYWAGGTNTSEGDVVSFGSPGAERQLKNVAAGRIADDSTDAINGSQLNSVTKRMSSGWAVEAEKDKTSSGVLKLNGATATAGTEVHSADGKTTTRENPGTATGNIDKIRLSDEVKIRVGDNLVLHQEDTSRLVYEDPDNPTRQTGIRVTSKFTYSLNPELTGLKNAQFKNDAGDTTDINGAGVTVTPVTAGKQPISLTTTGLNNGGNAISNVAGNLPETKNNDTTTGASNATTSQAAPTLGNATNQVNPTNAATVSDVLNAGWNLQGNNKAVDFVKPYDTVNFVNGDGTTATVESTDGKTSTVKYSVNLGEGLKKDDNNNITVKAADKSLAVGSDGVKVNPGDKSLKTTDTGLTVNTADKSLEVTNDGLKVKTDGTTITTDNTAGLKVVTGGIESVTTGADSGTVKVKDGDKGKIATVDSVVNAVNSAAWIATSAKTTAGELGAEAKNQAVKAGDKVTFEADKNIKITQAGSKFTFATRDDVSFNTVQVGGSEGPKFAKAADSSIKVSDKDGTEPVKITNVKAGEISDTSTDAINGSQFHAVAKNTIKLAGQNGTGTATETDEQELDKKGGIKFTVKSNDGTLLDVAAKGDTITLTPKTATLTTGTDGVPTANTDGGKLVTADQLVTALKEMGWKATAGNEGTGTVTGNTEALIKAGNTVTFKAGDNLAVKQDGKNFIYSLQNELTGLTSAEFKNQAGDKTVINSDGVTITPVNNGKQPVSLTKDGLNNGGNPITNVGSNLDGAKTGTDAPTTKHAPINSTDAAAPNYVNLNNAATVGDVLQAGWNLQGNSTAVDFVKPYDTVNFVNGVNTTAVVSTVDGKTNNVTYNITGLPITYTDKDGNPVSKIGDKFYKVNDKGQPLDAKGNPSTKVNKEGKPVDDAGDVIDPIDTTNNPVKTSLVNPVPKANKTGTTSPTTLDNVTSKLENYKADPVNGKEPAKNSLRDLTNTNVTDNTVATVGDIRNMGWLVSSNKTTGANGAVASDEYSEAVKNANEVRFVGEGSAIVSGKTEGNVRIITVKVDNQAGINTTVTPVNYTKADGTKVYPQEVDNGDGTKTVKFFENPNGTGKEIPSIEVITSVNGPKGTTTPATLSNVKSNLPDTKNNDATTGPSNATAAQTAPNTTNKAGNDYVNPNNAATVSDVLNAGWNLQGNGTAVDFVKPYDTVNFIDGDGTTAIVESADGKTSTVKYSVNLGNGLEKDGTTKKVQVKAADTSLTVGPDGVKVNPGDTSLEVKDAGLVVKTDNTTITAGDKGLTVNTGEIESVTTGANPGTVKVKDSDIGKIATVDSVVNAVNNAAFTLKASANGGTRNAGSGIGETGELIKAGNVVELIAGKNLDVKHDANGKITFATADNVSFNTVQVGGDQGPKLSKTDNGDLKVSGPNGMAPVKVTNVKSGLDKYGDQVNGADVPGTNDKNRGLVDLSKPANGDAPKISDNTAATVGDLRNMGWVVSAQGNRYSDQVRNANEVKFVGEGTAIVSGKTVGNVRTITVKVDDQISTNNSVTPVNYTKADGTKVYPKTVTDPKTGKEEVKFFENPDGSGAEVPSNQVVTSINGPEGTTSPTTLKNVKNNIPNVNDGTQEITKPDGSVVTKTPDKANINKAPLTAEQAAELANPKTKDGQPNPKYIGNNAATVSDVLNAGWNLQNNGTARDFVKPYDTVNFVSGVNTTAVVTTSDNGTTSNVTYNVTGLPMTYTDAAGNPVSKIGDKFYKVNDKGQPVDMNGKPSTKVNNNGEPLDENGVVIQPINTATNPLHSTLVNPNVTNTADAPNKQTTDPTQLGNVTSGLSKYGDTVDGKPVAGTTTANTGLIDLSKPTNGDAPKVSDNTAATVGDLRNMGWIVSSDKVTNDDGTATVKEYTEQVRNANEVKFVGKGTAIVSGKTVNGVRTITVKVDDQVSTNNAFMPTSFTTKDGTKVYPVKDDAGNVTYHTTPDGKGTLDNPDTVVNEGDVVTAVNGPKGTTTPTTLQNVKSNLPNVDDKKQKAFHPDGTEVTEPNSTTNAGNAKAPLSHTVVAAMMSPFMTNDEGDFIDENGNVTTDPKKYVRNPNFAANNAATVGDVLSAGWNLQNNGTAKDFVKPYDTVNFINGLGTTAVVTTREGNTTSDVSFNVKPANSSVTVDEDGVKVTTGEITPNTNGSVAGPTTPENAKTLKDALDAAVKELATAKDALKTAETALAANPKDPALQKAVEDKKADVAAKQTPVNEAQKAHDDAGLNKIATVQNVADTINNAGFNLKTSADGGEKLTTGTKNDGELIKPSNTVEMVAGKNLTVKQDANGKITYATKDNVTFTNVETGTLNVGSPNTYTDGKGNTYTKVGDKYYKPADVVNGAPKENATPVKIPADVVVKPVSPVTMKTEAAKPATNNAADAQPSSALNITAKDGKPTQITGVGSTLNTNVVTTTPEGTATKPGAAPDTKPKTEDAHLVDLNGTADAPINKNVAATVGDLQNMGWVVSAKDSNNYKDVVKNANVVDFKGSNGIEITGKTLADGTREITVGIKEGEVTNKVTITHADGKRTRALRVGNHFYKLDKDDRVASINKDEHGNLVGAPLHINPKEDTITNTGSGVVTGNTVANAIQASGWNIGLGSTNKDFSKETKAYDKVNPNDHVKFADGANANVSMVTVDGVNEDGIKEETTFIKVDVNRDLKIDSVTTGGTAVDKNGNNLVKVGDKYYKESDIDPVTKQLKETAKPVSPADVIPSKDGAMTVKDAKGNDGVSATAKDGKGTLTLKDAGKDGKDASQVDISTGKAPVDLNDTPKDAVHANDGKWYAPADVDVKTENGNTVVTPKAGKSPIADAPTMDRIQYKGTDGKLRDVATMDDGLRFQGDDGESISKPLNSTVQLTGGNREDTGKPVAKDATTTGNIGVFNTDGKLSVQLAKDLDKLNSANFESKTDKAGNPLKAVDGKYYPENSVVKEGKVYPEGTVIIDNKPYPAGTTKDAAGKVVNNGKPATEATPINPIDSRQVQNGPTSKLTGTGLTFNTPTPKDEKGKPLVLVDGKYYKADNLENGKPKADAKPEPVKPAQSTAFTPDGLVVTPETAKVRDANGNPVLDKDGREVVDPTKVVAFGSPTIAVDPNTGKPMVDPKTGEPVMKSGISAGGQVMANVAPGVLDTDAVNVSQLKGVSNAVMNVNNRMNRMGAQAAALAGLQSIQYDPLEPTQISAGLGHYKGSSALALGVNYFKNESTMFHLGASLNGLGEETMMNASVTWKFGARADETAVKDTFRQGPISASYTLQDKVSALEAQTRVQKEQLKTIKDLGKQVEILKELNEKQQEQIAELFKRLSEK